MPGTTRLVKLTTANGSDLRQLEIEQNNQTNDLRAAALAGTIDILYAWSSLAANSLQAIGRGSTDTGVATGAFRFIITGQAASEAKAAITTATNPTAQTVPADTWAIYALDAPTGGSLAVSPGAANATTGYATEALAIAALPPRVTAKARLGYYTVKTAAGLAWIGATDGLAGGSTLNVASQTNYYPYDGVFAPTGVAFGPNGVVTAGGAAVDTANGQIAATGTGTAWTAGRNGMLIGAGLGISSNDLKIANLACTFNCNGACNIAKTATTAGTTVTSAAALTTPANMWALLVLLIDGAGTITYVPGPANGTTGYKTEGQAKEDLYKVFPQYVARTATANAEAGKVLLGYATVQAQAANAWIAGTDAFAGGTTGNEAQATNYYSVAGLSLPTGTTSSLFATSAGTILTQAQL